MKSENKRRLINNELAARGMNQRIMKSIKAHTPKEEQHELELDFYCECADGECQERVRMSLAAYHHLHQKPDQFIICKGHVAPVVERIVKNAPDFQVVKKYAL